MDDRVFPRSGRLATALLNVDRSVYVLWYDMAIPANERE